jgi:hypothetical protein
MALRIATSRTMNGVARRSLPVLSAGKIMDDGLRFLDSSWFRSLGQQAWPGRRKVRFWLSEAEHLLDQRRGPTVKYRDGADGEKLGDLALV